jgi:PIN domain nuclease of toxin-antitoxin system
VNLLLDTHSFIWLDSAPQKLSATALAVCQDPDNVLYLSIVNAWEMQIKIQINRLKPTIPLPEMIEGQQIANDLRLLPIELSHIYALGELPLHHNDPFDRILLAQAKAEGFSLVSKDAQFKHYDVDVIW